MEINQVYEFVNDAAKQILGQETVVKEDLSNIVDIGKDIKNRKDAVSRFADNLVDRIGKVIFVDRAYQTTAPKIFKSDWEYGNIVQKIDIELPTATQDEAWELQDGTSYDPFVYHGNKVYARYFGEKHDAFSIPYSILDRQMKSAFDSPTAMGSFYSLIRQKAKNAYNLSLDSLVRATINNAVGLTYHDDIGANDATKTSGVKAINLLYEYNHLKGTALTPVQAFVDKEFLRWSTMRIWNYRTYRAGYHTLLNIGGRKRRTPFDKQHILMLNDFFTSSTFNLQSDTFHDEFVKAPNAQLVTSWQGVGDKDDGLDLASLAKIDIKTTDGDDVTIPYRIATIFDDDCLGINRPDYLVKSARQPLAEFTNYELKYRANHFNDRNENRVIFFRA